MSAHLQNGHECSCHWPRCRIVACGLLAALLVGCGDVVPEVEPTSGTGVLLATPSVGGVLATEEVPLPPHSQFPLTVSDFLYQLQDIDLQEIGATAYDLVIIDYSADGGESREFSAAEIAALKDSPGGPKVVLAYLSIGEAEDYRFYWQPEWRPGGPSWLEGENPTWPGNYRVRYWDPEWQAIIFTYLDRLLLAGFDGAYLDLIDGYESYAEEGRTSAAQEMADFVGAIRSRARASNPEFLVFVQNGAELARLVPGYLDHVDGIGHEEVYYGYEDDDVATPPDVTARLERDLDTFLRAGKLVLTVDYASTPAHVDQAYARAVAKGYVPFVTVRELDRLMVNPGHEPD